MKKIIVLVLVCFVVKSSYSQEYYKAGTQVSADGITFDVEDVAQGDSFFLDNKLNVLGEDDSALYYLDGRTLEWNKYNSILAKPAPGMIYKAIAETFTKEEFTALQQIGGDCPLIISYYVGPDGRILEVSFLVSNIPEMQRIPPSKFALLEKNLKKYATWEMGTLAKQLKYIHRMTFAKFRLMDLHYPGDPIPEVGAGQIDPDIKDPNLPGLYVE